MRASAHHTSTILLALVTLVSCQSGQALRPAVLEMPNQQTVTVAKTTLSQALGRAQVSFTPADLTDATGLSVLPPPLSPQETRSSALPEQFYFQTNGAACFLVNAKTGEAYLLDGVTCRSVDDPPPA